MLRRTPFSLSFSSPFSPRGASRFFNFALGAVTFVGAYNLFYQNNNQQQIAFCSWWGKNADEITEVPSRIEPHDDHKQLPVLMCPMALAPNVPPPITRRHPALLRCDLQYDSFMGQLTRAFKFEYWTISPFGTKTTQDLQRCCPGPFIRTRVGDVLEVNVTNNTEVTHNIDFHAVDGPGGGAPLLLANPGELRSAHFKLTSPGLYIYHCATAPIPMHIANGMYGLLLVEPEGGLPIVDKEYYVFQSEFYFDPPEKDAEDPKRAWLAYDEGLKENATANVFNGRWDALTKENALKCSVGDRVRLYVGNGGPNIMSSFHVIGAIFDSLYREGDLLSPPARNVQTTTIPPGGAAVVEMNIKVPGNYTLVDHALFRLEKGCVGYLFATGPEAPDLYHSNKAPTWCANCGTHP